MTGPLFPENYSKIWIRGRFITMAGVAVRGKLTLAPTVTGGGLVNRSLKLIMSAASFSADTDNDGYVALQVPATNDPDITPINFTYSVTTPIGQKFSIVVPYDTTPLNSVGDPLHGQPVIELIDMVPVGSSGGVGQLLRGIGIQSMVDNGAGGLLITYTDGATSTVAMPDTVQGPPGLTGPVGPAGPIGPTGATGPAGGGATKLTDLTDVTTTGAAVGKVVAVATVSGGVPTGWKLVDRTVIDAPAPTGVAATDTANLTALANATPGTARTIRLKAGTYVVSNLPVKTGLHWQGEGWANTILKLADATNAAVFVTDNFATLTGTSVTTLTGAPYGFAFSDLSVDGNSAQQSAAVGSIPAAINLYGHSYAMSGVHVRNAKGVGVRSEFGFSGSIATDVGLPSYEPRVNNVDIHHCGSWGWQHKGPTDAMFSRVVIWKTGDTVQSGAFWLERGNGVNFDQCHTFGHAGWSLLADAQFFSTACQWEIGERRLFTTECGGIWIRFDDSVIVGGGIYYISSAGQRDGLGLRLGDQANGKYAVRAWVDTVIYGCQAGSAATAGIHFNGSSNAVVRALVGAFHPDGAASATVPITGTPSAADTVSVKVSGVIGNYDLYQNTGAASVVQGTKADSAAQRASLSVEPVEVVPRWAVVDTGIALPSGTMRLGYFTPSISGTAIAVGTGVRQTAAAATPTLCRMGLYSVAGNGDLTLLTATPNDTALWNVTFSSFFRSFSASQSLVAGQRYAVGLLIVTAGAPPTLASAGAGMFGELTARAPRLAGAVTGQTDLPSTVAAASVVNTAATHYATINLA